MITPNRAKRFETGDGQLGADQQAHGSGSHPQSCGGDRVDSRFHCWFRDDDTQGLT